jgi:hypothetical protein
VIAGTIFAATKVPLCTWFRATYHLTQSKGGISSIELGRRLGVWKIKPKLMQAMMERDATRGFRAQARLKTTGRGRLRWLKTMIRCGMLAEAGNRHCQLNLWRARKHERAETKCAAGASLSRRALPVVDNRLRCWTGVVLVVLKCLSRTSGAARHSGVTNTTPQPNTMPRSARPPASRSLGDGLRRPSPLLLRIGSRPAGATRWGHRVAHLAHNQAFVYS